MCFYYAIVKKNPKSLLKNNVISEKQLDIFNESYLINGFENPNLPIINNNSELMLFEWGLAPNYLTSSVKRKEFRDKYNTLNAKSETIFTSKMYSEAILKRRCLVICSGFFEWREHKKKKYPYFITMKDDDVFVFGGVYNEFTDNETGEITGTFSIITTPANELMKKIHNTKRRMPLIIEPENAKKWLDKNIDENEIQNFLVPYANDKLKAHTIKKFIPSNVAENNSSDLIAYYHYPELSERIEEQGNLFENL